MTTATFGGVRALAADAMPQDHLRVLIHGAQGSGKTYLASSVAELGPTLYIDLVGEKGTESFRGAPWAGNVTVLRPTTVQQLDLPAAEAADLKERLTAVAEPDTVLLTITAMSNTRERAASLADAVGQQLVATVADLERPDVPAGGEDHGERRHPRPVGGRCVAPRPMGPRQGAGAEEEGDGAALTVIPSEAAQRAA